MPRAPGLGLGGLSSIRGRIRVLPKGGQGLRTHTRRSLPQRVRPRVRPIGSARLPRRAPPRRPRGLGGQVHRGSRAERLRGRGNDSGIGANPPAHVGRCLLHRGHPGRPTWSARPAAMPGRPPTPGRRPCLAATPVSTSGSPISTGAGAAAQLGEPGLLCCYPGSPPEKPPVGPMQGRFPGISALRWALNTGCPPAGRDSGARWSRRCGWSPGGSPARGRARGPGGHGRTRAPA